MKRILMVSAMIMLSWSTSAGAETIFYDSFSRNVPLAGTVPDKGGQAYTYFPSGFGSADIAVGTGGSAHLSVESEHSGAFVNFSVRTPVIGLNYAYSPVFYLTATFSSSDLSATYGGHLAVEVGINVTGTGGSSLVREQQVGLGQSGWYGDGADEPHTVAWGSGSQFGRRSLGDYSLGSTVTLALKFEEKVMNLPTVQYSYEVFAAEVPLSGVEPAWTRIAVEANRNAGYSVDYIGLNVGGINHGKPIVHSGYIDEIKVGKTWSDVSPIPEPASCIMLLAGLAFVGIAARGRQEMGTARA